MKSMALDKQMELFDEGGLLQEGGSVDEESGNDVPVGSLKEEVRDDIPAQLSEGEFVMPADVVRYHGLDKMMALRDEAKAGLQRMEDMGQMGNSEEAVIPDGIPFDLNDLDIEDEPMEMQVGGFVQQPFGITQAANQPFQYQQSAFQNYVPQVNVPAATTPTTYTPVTQAVTPTIKKDVLPSFETAVVPTTVTYVNDAGAEIQIPVDAQGNPLIPVPDGFKKKSETAVTEPTTPPVQPTTQGPITQQQDSGGDNDDTSSPAAPKTDQFGREEDPRISQVTQSEQFAKLAKEVDPRGAIEKIKDDFLGAVGVSTTSQEYQKALNELSVGVANYTSDPDEQSKLIAEIRGNINQPTRSELGIKKAPLGDIDVEDVVRKQKLAAEPVKVETTLGKTGVSKKATVDTPVTVTEAAIQTPTYSELTSIQKEMVNSVAPNKYNEKVANILGIEFNTADVGRNLTPLEQNMVRDATTQDLMATSLSKSSAQQKNADISKPSVSTSTTRTPTDMSPGAMGGRINVDEGKVDPGLAAAAAKATARNEETAGHQARYESQGYSPSDAAVAARNKTKADENVRQQTGNSEAKAVTDSSGKNVTSGTNPDGSPRYVTSGGDVNNAGGDGGTDSRVICTELYKQGKLSRDLYRMDVVYTARELPTTLVRGYHYWAIPMVPVIRKNKLVCDIFEYLTLKRAEEIAHIVDPITYPKSTFTGRLIKTVGEAICYGIGKFVKQKDYSVLYNGKSV